MRIALVIVAHALPSWVWNPWYNVTSPCKLLNCVLLAHIVKLLLLPIVQLGLPDASQAQEQLEAPPDTEQEPPAQLQLQQFSRAIAAKAIKQESTTKSIFRFFIIINLKFPLLYSGFSGSATLKFPTARLVFNAM